jgi:putative acid phosphatase of HAD superfamily subfamily IIIB
LAKISAAASSYSPSPAHCRASSALSSHKLPRQEKPGRIKGQRHDIPEHAGYTIVANIGDQPSNLLGGHAEKSFPLPDPFYRVP